MSDVVPFRTRLGDLTMAGLVAGPPQGRPVVLLHALGETSRSWIEVMARLDPGFRALALDLRGHGGSSWPGEYSNELMRDDVIGVLDQLGWDDVVLIGHSLGGVVAYLIAQAQPARVGALIVEDVPAPRPRPPRILEKPDVELPFDWDVVLAITSALEEPDPACWDQLPRITARTLVIAGGPGSHIPQDQIAETAARIPGARLLTIPASHDVHEPEPERFTAAVNDFLRP